MWWPWSQFKRYKGRAGALFEGSCRELRIALDAMTAEHAAQGRLQSGLTAKRAVAIFEDQSRVPLESALAEASKLIQHHGFAWSAAMSGISAALEEHLARGPELLRAPFRNACLEQSPAAQEAANNLLSEAGDRLRNRLADFRDGWTAPRPLPWKERYPLLYRIVLLAIGSAITLAATFGAGLLRI